MSVLFSHFSLDYLKEFGTACAVDFLFQLHYTIVIQMQSIRFILVPFGLAPAASMNHIHAEQ